MPHPHLLHQPESVAVAVADDLNQQLIVKMKQWDGARKTPPSHGCQAVPGEGLGENEGIFSESFEGKRW